MKNRTKFMNGVALLLLAGALLPTKGWAVESKVVRVCVEGAYPPFSKMTSSGEVVGFDIDIGKAIVEKAGKKYEMVRMDWDGIIPALLAKKCDAIIASMGVTEERKKKLDFTDKYYGLSNSATWFFGKKDKVTSDRTEALKGKIVGLQAGTVKEKYVKTKYPDVKVRAYTSQVEANSDLLAGRLDAVFQDKHNMKEFLESKEAKAAGIEVFGHAHKDPVLLGTGPRIAVRKGDTVLRDSLNKAIKDLRASGEYKKINDKYFDFDAYE